MNRNKYKLKKKNLVFFILTSLLFIIYIFFNLNLRVFLDTEIQYYLSKNKNISSIYQIFDEGNFFHKGKADYSKINLTKIIKSSPEILNGFFNENEKSKFEDLKIIINFKNLVHIYEDRRLSLKKGINIDPKFVPCKIIYKDNIFRGSARLKGDLHDHWTTKNRLSLRIKLKNGYINGTKEFSLHKPRARQFPYDYFFQKFNKKIGNPSSDGQDFFNIVFNNESWGIMHFEETINSDFLEKRKIKSSGVFRISNQEYLEYIKTSDNFYDGYFLSHPSVTLSIKGNDREILKDQQQLQIYSHILKSLKNKNTLIFDREKMIKNLISSLIWGSLHTIKEDNSWFFWNSYTFKLVPILGDQAPWMQLENRERLLEIANHLPFYYNFVFSQSPLTQKEFLYHFNDLSLLFNNENFIENINNFKKKYFNGDSLFKYSPLSSNINLIESNIKTLVEIINSPKSNKTYTKKIASSEIKDIKTFLDIQHFYDGKINLSNLLDVPIFIEKIFSNNKTIHVNKILGPSNLNNLNTLTLNTDFLGQNDYNINVISSYKNFKNLSKNKISLINLSEKYQIKKQLNFCSNYKNNLCILKKNIEVNQNIVFNERVKILSGSKIKILNNNNIIFNRGVDILGTNLDPIIISGDYGGNILINNSNINSITNIDYLNVFNLGKSSSKLKNFTGAINIYGGNVNIKNSNFYNNMSEDQINITNSEVVLQNLNIYNAISDGLDCDFCTGLADNLNFNNIDGDALDFAGSNLFIDNVKIKNVNDKGVSIGEKSSVKIKHILMHNVGTGIAVKDSSDVKVKNLFIDKVIYDVFMTYVKKPFFQGNTSLEVLNYKANSFDNLCVRQKNTFLKIGKNDCDEKNLDVKELYETRMKKL